MRRTSESLLITIHLIAPHRPLVSDGYPMYSNGLQSGSCNVKRLIDVFLRNRENAAFGMTHGMGL